MKKLVAALLCCWMVLISAVASACGTFVLIWDSDTRPLFEEEIRGYHYDTLGYVLNEILARHGYHFDPDSRYREHFEYLNYIDLHDSGFPYHEAPQEVSNEEIIAGLSDIELQNIALIKKVLNEKRDAKDTSGFYEDWMCEETPDELTFSAVGYPASVKLPINLKIPVYTGPGEHYLRGGSNRAMVSTNESIDAYGFDGDWLMIAYLVNPETRQTRVGYIHKDAFRRELIHPKCAEESDYPYYDCNQPKEQLDFSHIAKTLSAEAILTDDPTGALTPLAHLKSGEEVSLLMSFPREEWDDSATEEWAYVEYIDQKPMRGFIPLSVLEN